MKLFSLVFFFYLVYIIILIRMGAYLSEPITDKESSDEIGDRLICGASSMQGWRKTQEDAHTSILDYDTNTSLFAVYDGHGGHEVAVYSAQHLPEYLKKCEAYKKEDYTQALKDAFLEFDASLMKPEILAILKQLARNKNDDNNSGSAEDEEEENVKNLYEEAQMPLEQVMAKYQNDLHNTNKGKDENGKSSSDHDRHLCSSGASSSKAGSSSSKCSTSQIPDSARGNTEQDSAEASSSSKQTESGSSNGDSKLVDTVSETDKNVYLDSSVDAKVVNIEKSADEKLDDQSEDINNKNENSADKKNSDEPKEIKVKKEKLGNENSVEVNGEIGNEEKKGVNGDVEEGEGGKGKEKAKIISSLRRRCALYCTLLENQDNSDSDSDDEGDESFLGAENSSSQRDISNEISNSDDGRTEDDNNRTVDGQRILS
ncbi:hypothetical protein L9F63_002082, partial [Diploptera punctata]